MIFNEEICRLNENDLHDVLKDNYPIILQAMENENYTIDYPKHLLFKELLFEGNPVGFVTLELLQYYSNDIALNECYIMPEYRGKGLLAKEIIELLETPNIRLFIRRPSKSIVKILLDNGLAVLALNNLAISFIPFMVESKDVFKGKKIRKHVKSISLDNQLMYFSLAYDLKAGSVIFKNTLLYFPFENDKVLISKPRPIDGNKGAEKISPQYLKDLAKSIYLNKNLIADLKNDVYSRIRTDLSVENLIGDDNQLNLEFISLLDENNLSVEDGFKIRQDIINSLADGEIRHKGIKIRANYLMTDNAYEHSDNMDLKCPHCENRIAFYLKTCNVCGHDLTGENTFNSLRNTVLEDCESLSRSSYYGKVILDGCNLHNHLIEWALERGYDLEEVYDAQSEYSCFSLLQDLGKPGNYYFGIGFDSINRIREGSGMAYAINHDYVENLTAERYRDDLENKYSLAKLESELYDYGVPYDGEGREYFIEQIFNDNDFRRFLDMHFVLSEKGMQFKNDPLLKYFHENLTDVCYYYDFKRLYLERKDDLTLDEIADLLKANLRNF